MFNTIFVENAPLVDGALRGQRAVPGGGDYLMLRRHRPYLLRNSKDGLLFYPAVCRTEPIRHDRSTCFVDQSALVFGGTVKPTDSMTPERRAFDISGTYTRSDLWRDGLSEAIADAIEESQRALTEVTVSYRHRNWTTLWMHTFLKSARTSQIIRFVDFIATGDLHSERRSA